MHFVNATPHISLFTTNSFQVPPKCPRSTPCGCGHECFSLVPEEKRTLYLTVFGERVTLMSKTPIFVVASRWQLSKEDTPQKMQTPVEAFQGIF